MEVISSFKFDCSTKIGRNSKFECIGVVAAVVEAEFLLNGVDVADADVVGVDTVIGGFVIFVSLVVFVVTVAS